MSQKQLPLNENTEYPTEKKQPSKENNIKEQGTIISHKKIEDIKTLLLNISEKQMDKTIHILRRWLNS